jgi:hypothetical protein
MLVIDSSIFDRDDLLLFFHGNFSRKSALAAFAATDISWVAWKVDGRITLRLWTKNEREATDNITKILGVRPSMQAFTPRKKVRASLSKSDLLIMDALVDEPRVPFGEALQMIFGGKAGGFVAEFAKLVGEIRGTEFAPIKFEVADDLSYWSAEIPGRIVAKAEALSGPMTPPGKRVQTINAPGSETGPGTTATWGRAITDEVDAMGFKWEWNGRSSKHIPFDWSGP